MRQGGPQPVNSERYADAERAVLMTIRSRTTLVGVFPVISRVGTTPSRALGLRMTEFSGRFTLPFSAAWGEMVLTEGDYSVHYGALGEGLHCVEIVGIAENTPGGVFIVRKQNPASVVQNALVCTCRSGRQIIRSLELPAIGKAVSFAEPSVRKPTRSRPTDTGNRLAGTPV